MKHALVPYVPPAMPAAVRRRPLRSDGTRPVIPEVVEPRRERVILEETIVVRVRRRWIREVA